MQSLANTIKAHGGSWCLEEDSGARIRYNQIEETASAFLDQFDAGLAGRKAMVFLCVSNTIASAAVYFGLLLRGHAVLDTGMTRSIKVGFQRKPGSTL